MKDLFKDNCKRDNKTKTYEELDEIYKNKIEEKRKKEMKYLTMVIKNKTEVEKN